MRDDQKQVVSSATQKLITALEQGQSDALRAHLACSARFHNYSLGNILLIASQRPSATRVAGFQTWKTMDRHVKSGEKGILILAPCIKKLEGTDAAGNTVEEKRAMYFRAVYVFDVAQTDGKDLPTINNVVGEAGEHTARLRAFANSKGISIAYKADLSGARGASYRNEKKIEILSGLDPATEYKVLAHELGHQLLHRADLSETETTRDTRELEAEAVAYVLCSAIGMEADAAASDYIQLYDGNAQTLTASLGRIHAAAGEILDAIAATESEAA